MADASKELKRKRPDSPAEPERSPPRKLKRPSAGARVQNNSAFKDERRIAKEQQSTRDPDDLKRDASRSPERSPPRELKRPSQAARVPKNVALQQQQQAREQEWQKAARAKAAARGVHDVVKQHYNAVPQRGRDFRKTDSLIKGLRSFNNWVKSCLIQKFSPREDFTPGAQGRSGGNRAHEDLGLLVLDIGMGKGGDLGKWQQAPQPVALYVGVDPADISIGQARERYAEMQLKSTKNWRQRGNLLFQGEFIVKDAFSEWLGDIPIIQQVGIDGNVGPNGGGFPQRVGGGGFDVVTMMFCLHYSFESEAKARGMLKNVAGSLKKGGRFIGVIPNSDVLSAKAKEFSARTRKQSENPAMKQDGDDEWDPEKPAITKTMSPTKNGENPAGGDSDDDWDPEKPAEMKSEKPSSNADPKAADDEGDADWDPEKPSEAKKNNSTEGSGDTKAKENAQEDETLEWGNKIYRVKFPSKVPDDGVFRPPYGWKYFYFLEEAVETVPEYVVPWEGFRAMAVDYDLELMYRKPFNEVWDTEKDDPVLGPLSERMNVREHNRGPLRISDEEFEAASFYHAFCFYKT